MTAALLALGPAIGVGIARFGYGLILPEMRADLAWSYSQAGWMNTVNALGYLLGALSTARAVAVFGLNRVALAAIWITVMALALTALSEDFALLSIWRLLAGVSGALVFVAGGALAAAQASRPGADSGLVVGIYYAGPGLGIALTGAVLPGYLAHAGGAGWRHAWLLLAALCTILALLARPALRGPDGGAGRGGAGRSPLRNWLPALGAYAAFGAGYIGYMTFMFAYLKQLGVGVATLSGFWMLIGAAAMLAPRIWAGFLARARHGWLLAVPTLLTAAGAVLPMLAGGVAAVVVSAAVFGGAFFVVVAATTVFVRRNSRETGWTHGIGAFTVAFGAGQTVGPVLVGLISDASADLFTGLLWGTALLLLGALLAVFQRDRAPA